MGIFDKYCGICGAKVERSKAIERFGKKFCSEDHAHQYVAQVRKREAEAAYRGEERGRSGCC